mgnify:CR=1 FL=1
MRGAVSTLRALVLALPLAAGQDTGASASDFITRLGAPALAGTAELARILRTYGEERFASRIAAAIVRRRESGDPVTSTQDLAELVRQSVPAPARRSPGPVSRPRSISVLRSFVLRSSRSMSTATTIENRPARASSNISAQRVPARRFFVADTALSS